MTKSNLIINEQIEIIVKSSFKELKYTFEVTALKDGTCLIFVDTNKNIITPC